MSEKQRSFRKPGALLHQITFKMTGVSVIFAGALNFLLHIYYYVNLQMCRQISVPFYLVTRLVQGTKCPCQNKE